MVVLVLILGFCAGCVTLIVAVQDARADFWRHAHGLHRRLFPPTPDPDTVQRFARALDLPVRLVGDTAEADTGDAPFALHFTKNTLTVTPRGGHLLPQLIIQPRLRYDTPRPEPTTWPELPTGHPALDARYHVYVNSARTLLLIQEEAATLCTFSRITCTALAWTFHHVGSAQSAARVLQVARGLHADPTEHAYALVRSDDPGKQERGLRYLLRFEAETDRARAASTVFFKTVHPALQVTAAALHGRVDLLLEALTRNPRGTTLDTAVQAVLRWGTAEDWRRMALHAHWDDPALHLALLQKLQPLGDARAQAYFAEQLCSAHEEVVLAAARALTGLGDTSVVPDLIARKAYASDQLAALLAQEILTLQYQTGLTGGNLSLAEDPAGELSLAAPTDGAVGLVPEP